MPTKIAGDNWLDVVMGLVGGPSTIVMGSAMGPYFRQAPESGVDREIYRVYSLGSGAPPLPGSRLGELDISVTVLAPGRIGDEPFHTRGHFHADPDGPEFLTVLTGEGRVEMGPRRGPVERVSVTTGDCVLVPTGYAHRLLNLGSGPLVFISVAAEGLGHDYAGVAELGWCRFPR